MPESDPDFADPAARKAHNAHVLAAWEYGHDTSAALTGLADSYAPFTGAKGAALIAALDTLPPGTPYESYAALVDAALAPPAPAE